MVNGRTRTQTEIDDESAAIFATARKTAIWCRQVEYGRAVIVFVSVHFLSFVYLAGRSFCLLQNIQGGSCRTSPGIVTWLARVDPHAALCL